MTSLIIIFLGSKSDLPHAQKISEAAEILGLKTTIRIGSAHKTPLHVLKAIKEYEADPRTKVYITVAGRSNALSGFIDGAVSSPVIACPPPSDTLAGFDIFSSLRMPSGIAPAFVMDPANAVLLAAKIIGIQDPDVRARVKSFQASQVEKIILDDSSLQ